MDKNSIENVNNHVKNSNEKHDKKPVYDENKSKNSSNKKDRV